MMRNETTNKTVHSCMWDFTIIRHPHNLLAISFSDYPGSTMPPVSTLLTTRDSLLLWLRIIYHSTMMHLPPLSMEHIYNIMRSPDGVNRPSLMHAILQLADNNPNITVKSL